MSTPGQVPAAQRIDLSDFATWKTSASKAAQAAIDIYTDRDGDSVERELALHLARALRELEDESTERELTEALDQITREQSLRVAVEVELAEARAENQRLRTALTYYAEGRYPDNGETAREALLDV